METIIYIQNLKCGGCAATITNSLEKISGIEVTDVDTTSESITIIYSSDAELQIVKNRLNVLGYPVTGTENSIGKKAKSYLSCAMGRLQK